MTDAFKTQREVMEKGLAAANIALSGEMNSIGDIQNSSAASEKRAF